MPERRGMIQEEKVHIGTNFDTGYYVVLRNNVTVGDNVCIWSHTVIDPGVVIGNNVRIHAHCYVSQNVIIEDDVWIGPGVFILNDKYPPRYDPADWEPPVVKKGAIICAGVKIGPSVYIGRKAIIGMGANVLRSVPAGEIWAGNPARRLR